MPRNPELNAYLTRLAGQDEVLEQVARETAELPHAGMQSRADQAALLTLLAKMLEAREAVEVGTFTGYGAICIARGLAPGGQLTCFEVSEEYAAIAQRNLERAQLTDRVKIEIGPAQAALERLPAVPHLDLVYVDADKPGYPGYYDAIVPRLRPGGVVVLDNMLLGENVINPSNERHEIIADLNARIARDERVESVLLGLSDGVTIARKRT
jgi:caffeoyl-CoA O-methyltransferase